MELIKVFDNSIFNVQNNNEIIEYNMLTKRKYLHKIIFGTKIQDYYISGSNKVYIFQSSYRESIVWNGMKIKCDICIGPKFYKFIETNVGIHLFLLGRNFKILFSFDSLNKPYLGIGFHDISQNGKRVIYQYRHMIIFCQTDQQYHFNIICGSVLGYNVHGSNAFYDDIWVKNSNRLVKYRDITHGRIILNVDTLNMLSIDSIYDNYIEIPNNNLVRIMPHFVEIYDINKMKLIKQILCSLTFIDYSKTWNMLLTDNFEYYRFTSKCELQHVYIGRNYIEDCMYVPQKVTTFMDIILHHNVLFFEMPLELLNIELYQEILQFLY